MTTQHDTAPVEARHARPQQLAAVEHVETESRLVLVDIGTGKAKALVPLGTGVTWQAWTQDGSRLLYLAGQKLHIHSMVDQQDIVLAEGVAGQSAAPFAVSPDNRLIAIVAGSDILLVPLSGLPSIQPSVKAKMPSGCTLVDLRWSRTGTSVLVLCYPAPGTQSNQLLWVEAATGKIWTQPASPVKRLLGWRPSGELVVVRDEDAFDGAAILQPGGSLQPWGSPREPKEVFILAYSAARDLVLEVTASEDAGDPAHAYLSPFGEHAVRPWLHHFPHLADIAFSPDGAWAAFADRNSYTAGEMPGGDIYLVETASEDAHIAIRGIPGVRSYSSPALRP